MACRVAAFVLLVATAAAASTAVEHFVVIMLENRSFDHMCGWLRRRNKNIDGLTGKEFNVANGTKYYVKDTCPYVNPFDPHHDFPDTTEQIMGHRRGPWRDPAPMSGFAQDHFASREPEFWTVMHGFGPERVPAISTLAEEFALFDRYYSAVPGPTVPNRMFFHSGQSNAAVHGDTPDEIEGFPQETIYSALTKANVTWRTYYEDVSDLLILRDMRKPRNLVNVQPWERFVEDAATGNLPQFTFLSPRYYPSASHQARDQHPDHDVVAGEQVLAEVYGLLRNSPKWNNTVFMVTYDEHGGFYDHVPPPQGDVPNPTGVNATDDASHFNFTREGIRVCTVVASPLVPKGTVVHEPERAHYEHSSIWNTLVNLFGIEEPALTRRQEWAAPFDHVLSRDTPRTDCPTAIPTPAAGFDQRRTKAVHDQQRHRRPNGLQRELYAMMEGSFGRDGRDVGRFETQEDMGDHMRHHMELLRDRAGRA